MENTTKLLASIGVFIGLIPCAIAIIRNSSLLPEQRKLSILVFGATSIAITSWYIASFLQMNNLFLLHFYNIFEFAMISIIYKPYIGSKTGVSLIILFTIFAATNSLFFDQLTTFNVLTRSMSAFIFMYYALTFFVMSLKKMNIQKLERAPFFWISCGVLFYYAASYFIFIFSKDILPHEELFYIYWSIHAVFTILLYIFYSIALSVRPKA